MLGALAVGGANPGLVWTSPASRLDSAAVLEFLWREVAGLPAPPDRLPTEFRRARPCAIVLDNYSVHRGGVVKAALADLERVCVGLHFLPPHIPELNRIESLWRHLKHEEPPIRSHQKLEGLRTAVAAALDRHAVPGTINDGSTTNLPEAAWSDRQ